MSKQGNGGGAEPGAGGEQAADGRQSGVGSGRGPGGPVRGPMRGPGGHMMMPAEKPKDFKGTFRRLVKYLEPRKLALIAVLVTAILSTLFNIVSPKILGQATTELFRGMMSRMTGASGAGVDFDRILHLAVILGGLYVVSATFLYIQQYIIAGVSQKTVYDLREAVSAKLARLPLKFFDSRTHGEVLSRVTNDIDLISTTLQQSVSQIITSVVMLIGVIVMMLSIN